MTTLKATLSEQFQLNIRHIRSCVKHFGEKRPSLSDESLTAAISDAESALDMLEDWLLDEEQKQLLRLNNWDVFLLYASGYLFNLANADVSSRSLGAGKKEGDRPDGPVDPNQRHRQFILNHWKDLGIPDREMTAAIADICQDIAGAALFEQERPSGREHAFDGLSVNTALLSAAVRLALALNPKALSTTVAFYPLGRRRWPISTRLHLLLKRQAPIPI